MKKSHKAVATAELIKAICFSRHILQAEKANHSNNDCLPEFPGTASAIECRAVRFEFLCSSQACNDGQLIVLV